MKTYKIVANKTKTTKLLRANSFSVSLSALVSEKLDSDNSLLIELLKKGDLRVAFDSTTKQDKINHQRLVENQDNINSLHEEAVFAIMKKRNAFALRFTESFHSSVKSLYTSKRASVVLFQDRLGSLDDLDYCYSKSYGFPARWKNAGVVVKGRTFEIYTSRETLVYTGVIPTIKEIDKYNFDCCLNGDLFAIEVHKDVFVRYNKGKKTGYAVRLPEPGSAGYYYEHGKTLKEVKDEYAHKVDVYKKKEQEKRISERVSRAKSLIYRYATNKVQVSYTDARAVGFCNPGIEAFCERYGLNKEESYPVSVLLNISSTQHHRAVDYAVSEVAKQICTKI